MKKLFIILSMVFILALLTACSESKTSYIDITKKDTILESTTINKEEVVVEFKGKDNESDKASLEDQKLENVQSVQEQEVLQELEPEEKTEEKLIIKEEIEQLLIEEKVQKVTNKTLIASGETNFNPNQIERSNNIRLAANFINGLVLDPGDEFSFNNVVGERTKERGFLPADIFVGQSIAKGYGGGVCQTSSTICIAVRKTEMKILEQNPHSQRVTYTTIENEAMINYGTSDFRFANTYDNPVLLEISFAKNGDRENIKCDIYVLE